VSDFKSQVRMSWVNYKLFHFYIVIGLFSFQKIILLFGHVNRK